MSEPDFFKKWLDAKENEKLDLPPEQPHVACCGNCAFAVKTQQVNQLACTRYPPQVIFIPPNQVATQFPIMQSRQLCGEWQRKLTT
jgi:hypothetical protein